MIDKNKIQKEFQKWVSGKVRTEDVIDNKHETNERIYAAYQGFEAAYNLREQEVQRLRELVEWYKTGKMPSAETKQALQETTNKE